MAARFGNVLLLFGALSTGCGPSAPTAAASPAASTAAATDLIELGKPFPRLKVADVRDGSRVDLGGRSDHVTLVYMFATWDGQGAVFPRLRELLAKNEARGLRIVAVSIDDDQPYEGKDTPAHIREYLTKYNVAIPVAWDHGFVDRMAPNRQEPAFFVIDRRGITRSVEGGYFPDLQDERERAILKVLGER